MKYNEFIPVKIYFNLYKVLKYIDKILSKIMLTYDFNSDNINIKLIISLQGRVQVPTGGIAHEP